MNKLIQSYFNTAMLMALVIHLFYKDWGALGSMGVIVGCMAWAMFMIKLEHKQHADIST